MDSSTTSLVYQDLYLNSVGKMRLSLLTEEAGVRFRRNYLRRSIWEWDRSYIFYLFIEFSSFKNQAVTIYRPHNVVYVSCITTRKWLECIACHGWLILIYMTVDCSQLQHRLSQTGRTPTELIRPLPLSVTCSPFPPPSSSVRSAKAVRGW